MERTHKGIQQHLRSFFPISLGPLPAVYIGPYIYGVACLLGSSSSRVRYSPDEVSSFLLYNIPYRCLGVAGYLSLSLSLCLSCISSRPTCWHLLFRTARLSYKTTARTRTAGGLSSTCKNVCCLSCRLTP